MPTSQFDTTSTARDTEITARAQFVSALRELADFIEAHPSLPVPFTSMQANVFVSTKTQLAELARTPGVFWEKTVDNNYFWLRKRFGQLRDNGYGASYDVNISRSEVCRKIVKGTRIVPAQPEHEVEEVEWVCDEPLLRGATKEADDVTV